VNTLDQFKLDGAIAIITGGAGLLGIKHGLAIAEAGGIPLLVDIEKGRLDTIKTEYSEYPLEIYPCDITNASQLHKLREYIQQRFGKLDILVNNAALNPKVESAQAFEQSRLETYPLQSYEKELSVGLTGAFLCTQIFGTYLASLGKGVILNIASDLGVIAPNQSLYKKEGVEDHLQSVKPVTYSIIKHGLIGLTRYTATYWADKGVRCNALAPGGVENGQNEQFLSKIRELIPMGRMAQPDEYMAAVVFMVSDASSYMNGAVLNMDGGRTCW